MKSIAIALAVIGLANGAAHADSFRDQMDRQRQNDGIAHVAAGQSALVPAGRILSAGDLVNGNLSPSELVTVTLIPSSGVIDTGK